VEHLAIQIYICDFEVAEFKIPQPTAIKQTENKTVL